MFFVLFVLTCGSLMHLFGSWGSMSDTNVLLHALKHDYDIFPHPYLCSDHLYFFFSSLYKRFTQPSIFDMCVCENVVWLMPDPRGACGGGGRGGMHGPYR